MLWSLFATFLKVGFISFGGGYAMIPVIEREVTAHGWMAEGDFMDAVSVAGMSPGPIATNCATLIGMGTAGLPGAVAATLGMVLPSLVVIVVIAAFFYKVAGHKLVRSSFYGLRPIVTGLVAYAALHFAFGRGTEALGWQTAATLAIAALAVVGMLRFRMHPLTVIVLSGLVGAVAFH